MVSLGIGVDVLGGIPELPEDKDTKVRLENGWISKQMI